MLAAVFAVKHHFFLKEKQDRVAVCCEAVDDQFRWAVMVYACMWFQTNLYVIGITTHMGAEGWRGGTHNCPHFSPALLFLDT